MMLKTLLPILLLLFSSDRNFILRLAFDKDEVQKPPSGFTMALTGVGEPARWFVVKDETAPSQPNCLAQPETDRMEVRYPLCVFDSVKAKDVACGVSFKITYGLQDLSAGIVWRYVDKDNYYLACVGALESKVFVYKMEGGRLTALPTAGTGRPAPRRIKLGTWASIQVICIGNTIEVFFNKFLVFQLKDNTFSGAGKVGLWTKSGSYVQFDDMYIQRGD